MVKVKLRYNYLKGCLRQSHWIVGMQDIFKVWKNVCTVEVFLTEPVILMVFIMCTKSNIK